MMSRRRYRFLGCRNPSRFYIEGPEMYIDLRRRRDHHHWCRMKFLDMLAKFNLEGTDLPSGAVASAGQVAAEPLHVS
jgi:hypothetical protein